MARAEAASCESHAALRRRGGPRVLHAAARGAAELPEARRRVPADPGRGAVEVPALAAGRGNPAS